MRFIVRVDDCGWVPPDKKPDAGLEYFKEWFKAAGLQERHVPCVFGFIPATMTVREIGILRDLLANRPSRADRVFDYEHEIAIHGWDHERGAEVTAEQMSQAYAAMVQPATPATLNTRNGNGATWPVYIPPFNMSTPDTVKALATCCKSFENSTKPSPGVFLGGFVGDLQSVQYGPEPIVVERRVIHVPALDHWYDHAPALAERLRALPEWALQRGDTLPAVIFAEPPVVLTLHATWDCHAFGALREVFDLIAEVAVGTPFVQDYLRYQGRCGF